MCVCTHVHACAHGTCHLNNEHDVNNDVNNVK